MLDLQVEVLCVYTIEEANVVFLSKLNVDERIGIPPGEEELFIFLFDKDHEMVSAERAEFDLSAYNQKTLYSYLMKKLEPGDYKCRVVVRDIEMGKSLVGQYTFCVPEPASGAITIYSPLLLIPDKKAEFLRFSQEKKKEKKQASLIDFYIFMPQNTSPLMGYLESETESLWALVPIGFKGQESTELEIDIELIDEASADSIPVEWRIIDSHESESSMEFLLVEISLPDLEPGAFSLEFKVTDTNTHLLAEISASLRKK